MKIDKDILLDILILLVNINTNKTRNLANEILSYYENQPSSKIIVADNFEEFNVILIYLIEKIIKLKLIKEKNDSDLNVLFNKIKTNQLFEQVPFFLDPLKDILISKEKIGSDYLDDVSERLTNITIWFRCNTKVKKMFGYLNNSDIRNPNMKNADSTFNSIISLSEDIENIIRKRKDTSDLAIEKIHTSSKQEIADAYKLYKERNITGVIKLGLKGLNKMLGERRGVPLGRSVVFAALTHNYKSTMLLSVARWCKECNQFSIKNGKKPLILFISLENESHEDMMLWFKYAYETLLKSKLDKEPKTDEEIIQQIYDYFYQEDLEIAILRYLPSDFGFEELVDIITSYEDNGYYIPVCIIDYLSQMRLFENTGNNIYSNRGNYLLIKDLYNKVCNYLKSKGITLFTGHQLNSNASFLVNSGINPVKKFNQSHFAGSSDVSREVDIIIYMHIEKNNKNEAFLTLCWGKNRYETTTKEVDKFICYKFDELGILDDLNTKFMGVKDIYKINGTENNESDNLNISVDTAY